MMNFAICCVAFGDEHIIEFNTLVDSLLSIDSNLVIYVSTNNMELIHPKVNAIYSDAKWNFNLKKESIKEAFKYFDTILFMDTDMFVKRDVDFSIINNFKNDGMYLTRIPHTIFKYKEGEIISIYNMMKNTQYGKYIKTIVDKTDDLAFTEEQFFVLKLSNPKQKEEFYNVWDMIYKETLHLNCHPNHIFEEGLNIFLSCKIPNIPIYSAVDDMNRLYSSFHHMNFDKTISNITTLI